MQKYSTPNSPAGAAAAAAGTLSAAGTAADDSFLGPQLMASGADTPTFGMLPRQTTLAAAAAENQGPKKGGREAQGGGERPKQMFQDFYFTLFLSRRQVPPSP